MSGVTADQVKAAREIDLLTYLQINEPSELLPEKNGEYRTKTHGSLVTEKAITTPLKMTATAVSSAT